MSDKPSTTEQWENRIAEEQKRAEKFERLHADGVIEHELRKAAEEAGAFNADQIITILKGKSRLVDAGGKQVVRIVTVGDDGKEVHHSPSQAIGHLRQDKGSHNLFRDLMSQTFTLAPPAKIEAKPDLEKLLKNMPMEQYIKLRQEHPEILGLKPLPKRGR